MKMTRSVRVALAKKMTRRKRRMRMGRRPDRVAVRLHKVKTRGKMTSRSIRGL